MNEKASATRMVIEAAAGKTIEQILSEISHLSKPESLSSIINHHLGELNMSVDVMAGLAALNRAYVYKILAEEKRPGKDVLLRIAFVLEMDVEQTQALLKAGQRGQLSGSNQRDAIILICLSRKNSLGETDDILREYQLSPLVPDLKD